MFTVYTLTFLKKEYLFNNILTKVKNNFVPNIMHQNVIKKEISVTQGFFLVSVYILGILNYFKCGSLYEV